MDEPLNPRHATTECFKQATRGMPRRVFPLQRHFEVGLLDLGTVVSVGEIAANEGPDAGDEKRWASSTAFRIRVQREMTAICRGCSRNFVRCMLPIWRGAHVFIMEGLVQMTWSDLVSPAERSAGADSLIAWRVHGAPDGVSEWMMRSLGRASPAFRRLD